jgi:hypothetical protein
MQEQLLERIAIALENLKQKPSLALGLGAPPNPQYIFVGNEPELGLWYFLGENNKKNYIPQKALTGTIKSLEIVHREYKNQQHLKLDITMECDRTYVIRSGFSTVFSKGLLLALNTLNPSEFAQPLTIAVAPGDENVVFCRVYDADTKKPLSSVWDADADFVSILARIQSHLAMPLLA